QPDSLWHCRNGADVVSGRASAYFYRAGDIFNLELYTRRFAPARGLKHGIIAQIFPPWLICHGIFPVWCGADIRRDWFDQYLCDLRCAALRTDFGSCLPGYGVDVCGDWLQGRLRSVPHLDT